MKTIKIYDRKPLCGRFWENVENTLDGYSKAIEYLLRKMPADALPAVVAEWCGEDDTTP